jgi:hypothetical protein
MIGTIDQTPMRFRGLQFATENTEHHAVTRRIFEIFSVMRRGSPVVSVVKKRAAASHEPETVSTLTARRTLSLKVSIA